MDFHHQSTITDDPLRTVYFLGSKIFHPKLVIIVLKIIFCFYIVLLSLQAFYMISAPETYDIMNYGALMLQMSWAMLGIYVILTKNNLIEDIMSSIELWALDSTDEETRKKIRKESNMINAYVVLNNIVGVIWATTMVYPNENDAENLFPVLLFKKWFSEHNFFPGYVFKLSSFVTGFTMLAHGYQVIYATQHLKFQMYMFNKFVEEICYGFIESDEKVILDKKYQNQIEFRLKVLVKRHQDFFRWRSHTLGIMKHLIVPFSFGGCLIGISVAFGFFQITDTSPPILFWRAGSFAILATSTFCSLITAGQAMETESDNIYTMLMFTNWYHWRGSNRRLLALILCNSIKPISLNFTDSFAINLRLGVGICKMVYTAVSVFSTIQKKTF